MTDIVTRIEHGVLYAAAEEIGRAQDGRLTAERDCDRARDVAVELEQQLAAVSALHYDTGDGFCNGCLFGWPCQTARIVRGAW